MSNIDMIRERARAYKAKRDKEAAEAEILLDPVVYDSKPEGVSIGAITNRLPKNRVTVTLEELANKAVEGHSWKASVMADTSNASFVSSSLVALDIDNKNSYTSIDDFMGLEHIYKPCIVYETFSSNEQRERYRVVYAFDSVITDYSTIVALYNEVKAQYPTVEIDDSVDPCKILFGGRKLRNYDNYINATPTLDVSPLSVVKASTPATSAISATAPAEIDFLSIADILKNLSHKYNNIDYVDITEIREWINRNIKITDILSIEEGARFRCILDDHEDNHPSARIVTYGEEQAYMCSCDASGYRLTTLLSKLLDKSEIDVMHMLLDNLNIKCGSDYQRMCERYIMALLRDVDAELKTNIVDYLKKRKLYRTYNLIIQFANKHIVCESLGQDENKIVFFLSKRHLTQEMQDHNISGSTDANRKLNALCELGLLRKLTDAEIKQNVLNIANSNRRTLIAKLTKGKSKDLNTNRIDFYELVKITPTIRTDIESRIAFITNNAVRQKGNGVNRRVNVFGAEEVSNNINVQSTIDTKKLDKTRTKLETVITELITANGLFSEEDLAKAYRAKYRIKKADAEQIVLDFIPLFLSEGLVQRIRVNKATRKEHSIPKKYNSNSFIYIASESLKL